MIHFYPGFKKGLITKPYSGTWKNKENKKGKRKNNKSKLAWRDKILK